MLGAFETFKKAFLEAPVLAFADFNKLFLLENDTSKLGLGAVLSQKQTDVLYNILLLINCYISSIPINAVIKGFPMVISSDL